MNGNKIVVYKNGTAILAAKTAEITTSAGTIEVASATSAEWKEFIAGRKEWSLSCGHLVTTAGDVRNLLTVGSSYTIKVKERSANDNTGVTGTAILNSYKITATRGNLAQGSFQFKGSGALQ